jgi:hypothetical protein
MQASSTIEFTNILTPADRTNTEYEVRTEMEHRDLSATTATKTVNDRSESYQ